MRYGPFISFGNDSVNTPRLKEVLFVIICEIDVANIAHPDSCHSQFVLWRFGVTSEVISLTNCAAQLIPPGFTLYFILLSNQK